MRLLGLLVLVLLAGVFVHASGDLPDRGDPNAPANVHVSPHYLENAGDEVGMPNVVSAVLADYRGYDTLGETVVILTAGIAVAFVLIRRPRRQ